MSGKVSHLCNHHAEVVVKLSKLPRQIHLWLDLFKDLIHTIINIQIKHYLYLKNAWSCLHCMHFSTDLSVYYITNTHIGSLHTYVQTLFFIVWSNHPSRVVKVRVDSFHIHQWSFHTLMKFSQWWATYVSGTDPEGRWGG